ncbi:M56 family metallopeptidase [Tenacibaculum holothuriorum]|uniref:M56 family metallopeptidase n=1 Tax=Tenacibaculum holothuriorum TaxID=1635173 RepID=UPI000A32321D|nr:M56 family metallopeptidase [Tenacibaculum holothuriorum]
MITYLLKSASCLALLLVFYHLVLEREKMHQFNRFYLLGSILFSFVAPLYIIYIEVPVEIIETPIVINQNFIVDTSTPVETALNYWDIALIISIAISTILLIRFGFNLYKIYKKVTGNIKIKLDKAVLVLVDDVISPHTFWNYIFINKHEYNSQKIEDELFTHELTHVTQRHTVDVLLIEALKIIFWFNPIFYFLKKSIQLNHEFIADEKVINSFKNISEYQYLLLNKAAWNNDYYLASNLNYSLTKKRLVMMTTKTSKVNNWLKKLAVIPLLIGSVFVFAERAETYKKVNSNDFIDAEVTKNDFETENQKIDTDFFKDKSNSHTEIKSSTMSSRLLEDINKKLKNVDALKLSISENNNDSIPTLKRIVNRKKGTFTYTTKDGKTITKKFTDLTEEEKKLIPPPPAPIVLREKTLSAKLFQELKNSKKYAIWIDGKVAKNEILNNYKNTDFYNYSGSFVHNNARSKRFPQEYQYNLNTKKHILKIKKQLPPPPPPAKSNLDKLPPPPPKTGFYENNGQKLYYVQKGKKFTFYNKYGQTVTKEGKVINPEQTASDKVIPDQNITKVYKDNKIISEFKTSGTTPPPPPKSNFPEIKKGDITNIPPPPFPKNAKELIHEYPTAQFYFNGKKVSRKKALRLVKNKRRLDILTNIKRDPKVIKFSTRDYVRKGEKSNIPPPPKKVSDIEEAEEIQETQIMSAPGTIEVIEEVQETPEEVVEKIELKEIKEEIKKDTVPSTSKKHIKVKNKKTTYSKNGEERGWYYINKQTLFYVKKNGKTQYFNRWGYLVDKNGKVLNPKKKVNQKSVSIDKFNDLTNDEIIALSKKSSGTNPTYYLNGKLIEKEKIKKLDPNDIEKLNVVKDKNGNGSIYIVSKK